MILLNGSTVEPTKFPDGTSQVWKLPDGLLNDRENTVGWVFDSEYELVVLAQLKDLLDTVAPGVNSTLSMPFLPYARADKEVSNRSSFGLTTFAYLVNNMFFSKVTCYDAHSEKAEGLIKNLEVLYPYEQVASAADSSLSDAVCYPDLGAYNKYYLRYRHVLPGHVCNIDKSRDPLTGTITSAKLAGDVSRRRVLIVDDICDGGATFVEAAKLLYAAGATSVSLFVTHGLFTKGLEPLFDSGIHRVFTRDGECK